MADTPPPSKRYKASLLIQESSDDDDESEEGEGAYFNSEDEMDSSPPSASTAAATPLFDPTKHFTRQRKGGSGSITSPLDRQPQIKGISSHAQTFSLGQSPLIPKDTGDKTEEEALHNRIGALVAPLPSGELPINLSAVKSYLAANYPLAMQDKLKVMLRDWSIDKNMTDILLKEVAAMDGKEADQFMKNLEVALKDALSREKIAYTNYDWKATVEQLKIKLETHPFYAFAVSVENKASAHKRFTQGFLSSTIDTILPKLQTVAKDSADRIGNIVKGRTAAANVLLEKTKQLSEYYRQKDVALTESMPTTGLNVGKVIKDLGEWFDRIDGLSPPLPVEASVAEINRVRIDIIENHNDSLPDTESINAFIGLAANQYPWPTTKDGRDFHSAEGFKVNAYNEELIKTGYNLPLAVKDILGQSVDILLGGTVSKVLVEGISETDLALYGSFRKYIRAFRDNLEYAGEVLLLKPFYDTAASTSNSDDTRENVGDLTRLYNNIDFDGEDPNARNMRVMLTPYTPGVLFQKNNNKIVTFDLDNLKKNEIAYQRTVIMFRRIEEYLMKLPTSLQMRFVERSKVAFNAADGPSQARTLTIAEYLAVIEDKYKSIANVSEGDRKLYLQFVSRLRTGTNFEGMLSLIEKINREGVILKAAYDNDEELKQLYKVIQGIRRYFVNNRDANWPPDSAEPIQFPIQYHIDPRFSILYALLVYEFVRLYLQMTLDVASNPLIRERDAAATQVDTYDQQYAEASARFRNEMINPLQLEWSTLPIFSDTIRMDNSLRGFVDSAYVYMKLKAPQIPWTKFEEEARSASRTPGDIVYSGIDPISIITDDPNDPEAAAIRELLAEIVAIKIGAPNNNNTTVKTNPSSLHQMNNAKRNEGYWIAQLKLLTYQRRPPKYNPPANTPRLLYRLVLRVPGRHIKFG